MAFKHLDLFVADGFAVRADGRFHRQIGQDLEQMVLDHVADGADLLVKRAPALDAEILRHRDLHALDVGRFQNGSSMALAKRKNSMLCTGCLPR